MTTQAKVKMTFKRGTAVAKSDWQKTATNYSVTLRFEGRQMTVQWWAGSLAGEPKVEDVVYALCADSCGVEYSKGFEDWAANYGYDVDSREVERTYKACVAQTKRLKKFLGNDFDGIIGADEDEIKEWIYG